MILAESSHDRLLLRQMVERAYLMDPRATEYELRALGLDKWLVEIIVDHQARRLKGNVAAGGVSEK